MGFEATFCVESDKDIYMNEDTTSERCPFIGNERDLDDVIIRYGHKVDEYTYEFTKSDIAKLIKGILESVMNVYSAALDAHYEMDNVDEKELSNEALHREYYVIGRLMNKMIDNEYRYADINVVGLYYDDYDGSKVSRLVLNLMGLLIRAKDGEKILYKRSF